MEDKPKEPSQPIIPLSEFKNTQLGSNEINQDGVKFSYTISDIGQTIKDYTTWGYDLYNKKTEGTFVVASLRLSNTQLSNSFVTIQNFSLKDQSGRIYYPTSELFCNDSSPGSYVFSKSLFLKPDIPCTSKILFEVSKNNTGNYLIFEYK